VARLGSVTPRSTWLSSVAEILCVYALQAILPLLPAKQRQVPEGDWLERDSFVCCPDPDERLIMRIERTGLRRIATDELT
jgi:uncharacterized repeat protein (TIGR04076 family)